ncbi:MAG TPA: response regulator [Thermomicrobiaceae bacterium]|nr:response regulator [Thermomicrobiaceae bacterium]
MGGARVLVVDDDGEFIETLQSALGDFAELRAVASGDAALTCAAEWNPQVVLLDLLLPDTDGFDLLERLTYSGFPHTPAVLCVIDGRGADTRLIPFVEWPVGTVVRSAHPADFLSAILRALAVHTRPTRSLAACG